MSGDSFELRRGDTSLELPQDGWLGCTSGEASLELPKDGWLGCISGEVPLSFELRTLGSFELSKRGSPILNALTACPSIRGGCSSDAGGELGSRRLNALSTLNSRACSLIRGGCSCPPTRGGCSSEEGSCLPSGPSEVVGKAASRTLEGPSRDSRVTCHQPSRLDQIDQSQISDSP
jgi:hypothetical protein